MSSSDHDLTVPSGMTAERAREVRQFVDKISQNADELQLDDGSHEELKAHISKIEENLTGEDHSIVDDALEAMHRLLASSSTQKATELLKEAGRFFTGVG